MNCADIADCAGFLFLNHQNDVKGLNRLTFIRNLELVFRNSVTLMSVFSFLRHFSNERAFPDF